MSLFGAAHRLGETKKTPFLKSVTHVQQWCSLLKEDPKYIQISWHMPWVLLASAFFIGNQQFLLYQEIPTKIGLQNIISIYFILFVLFFFAFFEFWKVILINITAIFIMSAKLAPLVLLNIKIFWKKYYDVIISAHDSWIKLYCRCGYMTKVW